MSRFDGQIAIVTGGTSGIGRASAELLARDGATVVACGRRAADLPVAGTQFHDLDVTDPKSIEGLVADILAKHGRIDILVNSAGIASAGVEPDPTVAWDHIMAVNLRGTMLMCGAVLPVMTTQARGAIVNVGSGLGILPRANMAAYAVSKAGVIQLTKCLTIDCADTGVRVNCVCPGLTETAMTAGLLSSENSAAARGSLRDHAMRRAGQPKEIAATVAFLASARASYITGAILTVDGGYAAGKWMAA